MLLKAVQRMNTGSNKRTFFESLNFIFNTVDKARIEAVGPDRACAEWLMRNGAYVRWVNSPGFVAHYNLLPLSVSDQGSFHIEEVKAQEASITYHGYDYFKGCNFLTKMSFEECWYFNDRCIGLLNRVENLKDLRIAKCPGVTKKGALNLAKLRLSKLTLGPGDSLEGKDLVEVINSLQEQMPNCHVEIEK